MDSWGGGRSGQEHWWMRLKEKVEIVNIFRIQVKRSTFVKFQLTINEKCLMLTKIDKLNYKMHSWGVHDKNIDE